ncbi:hypothetical protein TIFTF001_054184 [Ficus carica]|uniref:Uncharacterized protein n=1 Tax=Ficus carica TaxID=3494 RepID=A0AA88ECQ8_FICCA|nr:hypothetical protein TIFTF001_054184 [Ficus carica]
MHNRQGVVLRITCILSWRHRLGCDSFHVCQPCSRFQPIHAAPALPPCALNPSPRTTASPGPRDSRPESSAKPSSSCVQLGSTIIGPKLKPAISASSIPSHLLPPTDLPA